jgi:hypothetical protein
MGGATHYQRDLPQSQGFDGFSTSASASDSGRSDTAQETGSGGGGAPPVGGEAQLSSRYLPQAALGSDLSPLSFSTSESDSSSLMSPWSPLPAIAPQAAKPLGAQFPAVTKYAERLKVDSIYANEYNESSNFLFTKVFQKASAAEFFATIPEARRKQALKGIGWTDEEVAELEATQTTKVQYIENEDERANYKLNLGAQVTQGSSPDPFDTSGMFANGVGQGHAIFVMDPTGAFYAGRHKVARFHHSTFLAGGDAASAGTIQVLNGQVKHVTAKSGHYQPGLQHLQIALAELRDNGVSLSGVTVQTMMFGFQLDPPQPAEDIMRGFVPGGAQSASLSSGSPSWTPSSISDTDSSAFGGMPVSQELTDFEKQELEKAGGADWQQKLDAMNTKPFGLQWSCDGFSCSFEDVLDLLKGIKQPSDLVF